MFCPVFELVVKETVFHLWLLTGLGFIPETFGAAGNTFALPQKRRAESDPARRFEGPVWAG
jgi:hypothetical protein